MTAFARGRLFRSDARREAAECLIADPSIPVATLAVTVPEAAAPDLSPLVPLPDIEAIVDCSSLE